MSLAERIQTLEPGSKVELYVLDLTALGGGVLRFHSHLDQNVIVWQGVEYDPWPVSASGFAVTSDQPPQPRVTVSNVQRAISTLCRMFDDCVGAIFTRKSTLVEFLDAENFPAGNPSADPTEHFPDEIWFVERKAAESAEAVEFELSSPMDFSGVRLPRRQIISGQCSWAYRSPECGYTGGPVADETDRATNDPAQDRCGKRLRSCRMRFGENSVLPTGEFPAAGLVRY